MTLAPERPVAAPADDELRLGQVLGGGEASVRTESEPEPEEVADEVPAANPALVSLAGCLSASGAGYVIGSLFVGLLPRLVAVAAAALGAGLIALSYRVQRSALVQILVAPVAAAAGALLVLPDARGGTANLPGLVVEALRAGGLGRPPVSFDPGWRFLLVVTVALLAAAAAALGTGLNRPKLAAFLPLPVAFAALGATSAGAGLLTTIVPLVLVMAALAVSYGAQLAQEGASTGRFELRRLAKGGGVMLLLAALLGALTQVGFLFPPAGEDAVIPPQPPRAPAPEPDRELFVVDAGGDLPWRLGVLDGYDGTQWLTPPYDPRRLVNVGQSGRLPDLGVRGGSGHPVRATVTVSDVRGHLLVVPANPTAVRRRGFNVSYDPRTQTLTLPDQRAERGMTYQVEAPAPPRARDLVAAPPPPANMKPFLAAPPVPVEIADLLAKAPRADAFTRLQYVRQRFYAKVVAAGAGKPAPVPPSRVVALLDGAPGSPYEITAAEALLARWTGVPSRIGFGYFGGDPLKGGRTSFRPKHGATWLEAYFSGQGWVPIVGTPPRAQSSLSSQPKNSQPSVRPSENLTLPSYVPVRVPTVRLLYVLVQYWVLHTVPYLLVAGLALWLYPALAKLLRRRRRERWARRGEPADRIRVAYATWRDLCHDLGIGDPSLTPLEFVRRTEPDPEHSELAWLVTRCLWGDLSRDLRLSDVESAEEMTASLSRRLRSVQPATSRLLALAARRSLRDPYTRELPNLWWPVESLRSRLWRAARRALSAIGGRLRSLAALPRRGRPLPTAGLVLLAALLLGGCAQDVDLSSTAADTLPQTLVPATAGDLTFVREPKGERVFQRAGSASLVGTARVFSVRRQADVVAALQIAAFKRSVAPRLREVRAGLLQELGGGQFRLTRIGMDLVYVSREPDRRLLLYFPPGNGYYELLIARGDFPGAEQLLTQLITAQTGRPAQAPVKPDVDVRRGFED